jgi:hypothetical protein
VIHAGARPNTALAEKATLMATQKAECFFMQQLPGAHFIPGGISLARERPIENVIHVTKILGERHFRFTLDR